MHRDLCAGVLLAILVALIFSAVDIMGEDEDGLSEKNCQNKCR